MRRAVLAALAILASALLAGCGGGSGSSSIGDATVTIPSDVHGVGGELKAVLDQYPYQGWYTSCVETRFEAALAPGEAESLAEAPEAEREAKLNQIIAKVGPICEKTSNRPLVDPNATSQELDLLRAALVPEMEAVAKSNKLDAAQSECLAQAFEKLPDRYIIEFGNGTQKIRKSILLTVFKTCVEAG